MAAFEAKDVSVYPTDDGRWRMTYKMRLFGAETWTAGDVVLASPRSEAQAVAEAANCLRVKPEKVKVEAADKALQTSVDGE